MRADDEASPATRPAKDHRTTPQILCGRWLDEANAVGLPVDCDLDETVCWRDPPGPALDFDGSPADSTTRRPACAPTHRGVLSTT